MAKASDNPYPSMLVVEGTVPASPAAGRQRIYIDTADHVFKRVDSSGVVVALELSPVKVINAQTGTSYTLLITDATKFLTMSNASASTLTIPPNSSVAFPVGTQIEGAQLGAGQVTLTAGAGVTVNATPGLKVAAQYGTFGFLKLATDTWLAYGRLSA
jgi:2-keto-4-pentenoate hydratase